ncbi:hypothetical protein B0H17DRAFT_1077219 [Mycena rosella]|uniref:Uncharacterized protein n=1 Tax=Mycena rosella TaxID=1033263 RepID=A0AAD7GE31_MYCRO|nr:hypothetical protein B0H17DRAFT_1077219 [Mycena rosella]
MRDAPLVPRSERQAQAYWYPAPGPLPISKPRKINIQGLLLPTAFTTTKSYTAVAGRLRH